MGNPFDITFSKLPAEAISRYSETSEIMETFMAEPAVAQVYVISGVRGSGKTVLMNTIANALEEEKDWVVARLNPKRDLIHALGVRLCEDDARRKLFRRASINVSFYGVGVGFSHSDSDEEVEVEKMLKSLKKHGKRVLVTIDEISNTETLKVFASSFQIYLGQELPVFLLMTGIYENIEELQNDKALTFFYRAPRIKMLPLNMASISNRYRRIFKLDDARAMDLAKLTCGFPFAFQALGYVMWNHPDDEEIQMQDYYQLLEDAVYEKLWSELSRKDRVVITGIAHCPGGKRKEIVDYLGFKEHEINQYRKRLIKKGLINGDEYGYMKFTLPLFEQFVLEKEE